MGLESMLLPDASYRRGTHASFCRHRGSAPLRRGCRLLLQRRAHNRSTLARANRAGTTSAGFFLKDSVHAPFRKSATPTASLLTRDLQFCTNRVIIQSRCCAQNDLRPLYQPLRLAPTPSQLLQFFTYIGVQNNRGRSSHTLYTKECLISYTIYGGLH